MLERVESETEGLETESESKGVESESDKVEASTGAQMSLAMPCQDACSGLAACRNHPDDHRRRAGGVL